MQEWVDVNAKLRYYSLAVFHLDEIMFGYRKPLATLPAPADSVTRGWFPSDVPTSKDLVGAPSCLLASLF